MLQYLAQGACMALEDGVALADQMAAHSEDQIPDALIAYQEARRLRTARVQLQSREVGDHVYHPDGAHAALRNEIMGSKTPEEWYEALDWLYGETV